MLYIILSALIAGLAGAGESAQLRAIVVAARYCQPEMVTPGILLSIGVTSAVGTILGAVLHQHLETGAREWLPCGIFLFLAFRGFGRAPMCGGLNLPTKWGAFPATLATLLHEQFGGNAQFTTLALVVAYGNAAPIFAGCTLGETLIILPVTLVGKKAMLGVSLRTLRRIKLTVFIALMAAVFWQR